MDGTKLAIIILAIIIVVVIIVVIVCMLRKRSPLPQDMSKPDYIHAKLY